MLSLKKQVLIFLVCLIALILAIQTVTNASAQEQYEVHIYEVFEWLDHRFAGNWSTSIDERNHFSNEAIFFEDGSWRYHQYSGCVDGWLCDDDLTRTADYRKCVVLQEVGYEPVQEYDIYAHYCTAVVGDPTAAYELVSMRTLGSEALLVYVSPTQVFLPTAFR